MDIKDIVAKITDVAPLVGSLFGPGGTIIGSGIKLLASTLGVEPTQEAVMAEIKSNPDALLKLKEFEGNNKVQLQQLTIQQEAMAYADTLNARQRQIEHEKVTGKSDLNLYILAWVIMGGFIGSIIGLIIMATVYPLVNLNNPLLNILFGSLSTDAGMVVGYFFGSSKGSADKTNLMALK